MTAAERAARTTAADQCGADAYRAAGGSGRAMALVAVGGYGRGELAPYSDLDLVLVHTDQAPADPAEVAAGIWYPLWDAGLRLDHAVRSVAELREAAAADLRVGLGLLDLRHVAGDPHLTLQLRTQLLSAWRRDARRRLPELRDLVDRRHAIAGELAHASVPDLKEAEGGLRDAVVMRALVATWLVDVPHADLERCRTALLDVRDIVQDQAGRATDRVAPEAWAGLATGLGLEDPLAAQLRVRSLGRRMAHLSRLSWRRAARVMGGAEDRAPAAVRARRPQLEVIAPGVAISEGEVVLAAAARPERDPLLLLRCAAEASARGLPLAPPSAARLGRMGAPLAQPWPAEARHLLVRLLAGSGLLGVWETLEETGALDALLPEWERIRLLPHASAIHRFTVDRHVIETCLEAGRLIRQVTRPDLLLIAALLHDIGKGGEGSHSIEGEAIARRVSRRMGFGEADAEEIARLVRWHLLLGEVATTRDLEDPATASLVAERLGSEATLALLRTLTEADARAASPQAWTAWRARLIDELVERVRPLLADSGAPIAEPPRRRVVPDPVRRSVGAAGQLPVEADRPPGSPPLITVTPSEEGALVRVSAPDRVGLLADIAAALAWQRCGIRSARAWSEGELGASEWQLDDPEPDARLLRHHFEGIVAGRLDPGARLLRPTGGGLPPLVLLHPEASTRATVIEVRAADRQGLLYAVLSALTRARLAISSAHITTIGPQAVDVFYVQEPGGESLSAGRASAAADAIRAALVGS